MTNVMKEDLPREYLLSSDIHLVDYHTLCEVVNNSINSYSPQNLLTNAVKKGGKIKKRTRKYSYLRLF